MATIGSIYQYKLAFSRHTIERSYRKKRRGQAKHEERETQALEPLATVPARLFHFLTVPRPQEDAPPGQASRPRGCPCKDTPGALGIPRGTRPEKETETEARVRQGERGRKVSQQKRGTASVDEACPMKQRVLDGEWRRQRERRRGGGGG